MFKSLETKIATNISTDIYLISFSITLYYLNYLLNKLEKYTAKLLCQMAQTLCNTHHSMDCFFLNDEYNFV